MITEFFYFKIRSVQEESAGPKSTKSSLNDRSASPALIQVYGAGRIAREPRFPKKKSNAMM